MGLLPGAWGWGSTRVPTCLPVHTVMMSTCSVACVCPPLPFMWTPPRDPDCNGAILRSTDRHGVGAGETAVLDGEEDGRKIES